MLDTDQRTVPNPDERLFRVMWNGERVDVMARSSFAAQTEGAAQLRRMGCRIRKDYEVSTVLLDRPIETASLG